MANSCDVIIVGLGTAGLATAAAPKAREAWVFLS